MEKKQWSKPECERVKLVQEEAVLGACKGRLMPGAAPYGCHPGHSNNCKGSGS